MYNHNACMNIHNQHVASLKQYNRQFYLPWQATEAYIAQLIIKKH